MKPKVAIVRGKFLNRYEMQFYEPLTDQFDITAFGSTAPFHDTYAFPVKKLWCPLDLPDFPMKLPVLNRLYTDAHYLSGLEQALQGFDLVHTAETYFRYTQQCLNAKKSGAVKKVVATVLENIPFNNEGIRGRTEFKQRARTELDHMIALTERTKKAMMLEGANEDHITVISHFIDTNRFVPRFKIQDSGFKNTITLLFCGRLEKYKGVFELLYAIKMLLMDTDVKDYSLGVEFVGDGSEKTNMLTMEKRLGIEAQVVHKNVTYDEMPAVYQNADIYVAPSKETETWQEQYNTTLLEAQASGLPIVTTFSGGIPENVGNAAILVQPGDVISLHDALKTLILSETKRKELGVKARERAETVHDRSIGSAKIAAIWQKVLKL